MDHVLIHNMDSVGRDYVHFSAILHKHLAEMLVLEWGGSSGGLSGCTIFSVSGGGSDKWHSPYNTIFSNLSQTPIGYT